MYISDIAAYYAALLSAKLHYGGSRALDIDKRIKKVLKILRKLSCKHRTMLGSLSTSAYQAIPEICDEIREFGSPQTQRLHES